VIPVPLWTAEEQDNFLNERVRLHQAARPEPCTDEERWKTSDVWALMKEGRKSAVKLFSSEMEANSAADSAGNGHSVVHRRGEYKRCANYCSVSHGCPVWQSVPF
jgi:hypothetical protein